MNILDIIKNNKKEIIISNIVIFYSTIFCYQIPLILNLYFKIEPHKINLNFIDDKIPFFKFFIIFYVYNYLHIYLLTIYKEILNKVHSILNIITSIFIVYFSIYLTNKFNIGNKIKNLFNFF